MCHVINSENLLANFFSIKKVDKVSIPELKRLRQNIEKKLLYVVYVDITKDSIISAIEVNNGKYTWDDDCIIRGKEEFDSIQKVEDKYNWNMPKSIKEIYLSIIDETE